MSNGFVNLSDKITSLTNEVFENSFDLPDQLATQNDKLFIILDDEKNKIKQIYKKISDTEANFHNFTLGAFYTSESFNEEEYNSMFEILDPNRSIDVIFVLQSTKQLEEVMKKLYDKLIQMASFYGQMMSSFVRFVFFRIFYSDENTEYYQSETRKIARLLYSFSLSNNRIDIRKQVGTRIYNYLMKFDKDTDIECLKFVDKIYSIVFYDSLVESAFGDMSQFKEDDCPWYTFKIRKMYIPEYILLHSLLEKVYGIFFSNEKYFKKIEDVEVKCAKQLVLKELKISGFDELDEKICDYAGYVPIEIEKNEYEDVRTFKIVTEKQKTRFWGFFPWTNYSKKNIEEPSYEESTLNTNQSILLDRYVEWINEALPVEKFFRLIFDSLYSFIDIKNDNHYDIVRKKIEEIVNKVFVSESEKQSIILEKLKTKYGSSLSKELLEKYCSEIRNATINVYRVLNDNCKNYEGYMSNLNQAPIAVLSNDIGIHNLTREDEIYRQLIAYLEESKEVFSDNWMNSTNSIKDGISLDSGKKVYFPLAADCNFDVPQNTKFPLSQFEKRIKRESQIFYIRLNSIDDLKFGTFDKEGDELYENKN